MPDMEFLCTFICKPGDHRRTGPFRGLAYIGEVSVMPRYLERHTLPILDPALQAAHIPHGYTEAATMYPIQGTSVNYLPVPS